MDPWEQGPPRSAAVLGTTIPGTRGWRTVTGTSRANHKTTSVSGVGGYGPSPSERLARAVWIPVQAGVPRPLPGFGPGERSPAERQTGYDSFVKGSAWSLVSSATSRMRASVVTTTVARITIAEAT